MTMEIELDDESLQLIETMIATGRYATPSDVICTALEMLMENKGWAP